MSASAAIIHVSPSRFACMHEIAIAKSPLHDAKRRQSARLLTTTIMCLLVDPFIFYTALLIGWKEPCAAAYARTFNFYLTIHPAQFGCNSTTCNISHEMRAQFCFF